MTEKEKMTAGLVYQANDKELIRELNEVKDLCWEYNHMRPTLLKERNALLQRILGKADDDTFINQPFYCDYGRHIHVGRRFFANFNLTILDEAPVTIGDDCFMGPNVSIYTASTSNARVAMVSLLFIVIAIIFGFAVYRRNVAFAHVLHHRFRFRAEANVLPVFREAR